MQTSISEPTIVRTTKGNYRLRDEDVFLRLVTLHGIEQAINISVSLRVLILI